MKTELFGEQDASVVPTSRVASMMSSITCGPFVPGGDAFDPPPEGTPAPTAPAAMAAPPTLTSRMREVAESVPKLTLEEASARIGATLEREIEGYERLRDPQKRMAADHLCLRDAQNRVNAAIKAQDWHLADVWAGALSVWCSDVAKRFAAGESPRGDAQ